MGKMGIIFNVSLYLFIFSKTCFNTFVATPEDVIVPKSMDKYSYDMELTEGNRFNLLQQMDRSLHLRILFQSVAL
jgi:hypothetical protein